jgi:hypothetical protein
MAEVQRSVTMSQVKRFPVFFSKGLRIYFVIIYIDDRGILDIPEAIKGVIVDSSKSF